MADLYVNRRLTIRDAELDTTAARSSGPGGQNVNKVNSKVTLKWSPGSCEALDPQWRKRLTSRYRNRINRDGQLVLSSQRFRDQVRNLSDVRGRLVEMLRSCESPPKKRKATRPTAGSKRRRLKQKKITSQKKQRRQPPSVND